MTEITAEQTKMLAENHQYAQDWPKPTAGRYKMQAGGAISGQDWVLLPREVLKVLQKYGEGRQIELKPGKGG